LFGKIQRNNTIPETPSNISKVFKEKPSKINLARLSSRTIKKTRAKMILWAFKYQDLFLPKLCIGNTSQNYLLHE